MAIAVLDTDVPRSVEIADMSALLIEAGVPAPVSAELADLLDAESVRTLAAAARAQAADGGLRLLGPDGLLAGITKRVLEAALEAELDDHLAAEAAQAAESGSGPAVANQRNGRRAKKVMTEVGEVRVDGPAGPGRHVHPRGDRQVQAPHHRHRRDGRLADRARDDRRRHRGAPQRRVRHRHHQGDRLHDHRPGAGGHARVAGPAAGRCLPGGDGRRDPREDPGSGADLVASRRRSSVSTGQAQAGPPHNPA